MYPKKMYCVQRKCIVSKEMYCVQRKCIVSRENVLYPKKIYSVQSNYILSKENVWYPKKISNFWNWLLGYIDLGRQYQVVVQTRSNILQMLDIPHSTPFQVYCFQVFEYSNFVDFRYNYEYQWLSSVNMPLFLIHGLQK